MNTFINSGINPMISYIYGYKIRRNHHLDSRILLFLAVKK